jgi:hypothetical protein
MAQLLQNIYSIAPVLFVIVLIGAAIGGFWLMIAIRKNSPYHRFYLSDRLFFKRNANRLRKMQLH